MVLFLIVYIFYNICNLKFDQLKLKCHLKTNIYYK